ncbi:MAG TPA: LptA/OstA family protein [Caulobacteraceae bacterium]|jgi:lipopolysaccharide export system protein LptA|nr:LptA/OstA family protein [Caulobacteraceae bacterium]
MNRTLIIGLAGAAALVMGAVAEAQISPTGGPIDISADHVTADNNAHSATYEGHVEALQGGNRMRSDTLNVFFKQHAGTPASSTKNDGPASSWGGIDHLEAIGNVYFVTPTQVIRGDRADYTQATDTLVVTGQVVVTQGEDVMRGTRLTYVRSTGKSTMDAGGGRVRTIFYPDKKTSPGA